MTLFPEVGWVIDLTFSDHHKGAYRSSPDIWKEVSEFVLHKNNAPGDLEVGDRLYVQVNKLDDDTVRVQNFNPGRNDQLLPGRSLTTKVTGRSAPDYSKGEIRSFPFIDTLRIYGEAPADMVSAPVIAVVPMDGYAVTDISHYQWPDDNEMVRVFTSQGQSIVRSLEYGYEFPIDHPVPITGVAQVRVSYEGRRLVGTIKQFQTERPEVGDVISGELHHSKAKNTAWFGEYGDRIQIDTYPPVSGTTKIEITQAEHPLTGEVVDPPESVPEVGDTVIAHITGGKGSTFSEPEQFDARISLESESQRRGYATIQITGIGESIKGEVLSYEGMPTEGDIIAVEVSRGNAPVTGQTASTAAPIRIEENILASGTVDVRVTGKNGMLTGVIESYRDLLPKVGDTVSAKIDPGITISTAVPHSDNYVVYLKDPVDYEGSATVRITGIEGKIKGKIVERNSVNQSVDGEQSNSPFQSESSMWNITRKKL